MEATLTKIFFNNLFTILSCGGETLLLDRRSVIASGKEHGMAGDQLRSFFQEWRSGKKTVFLAPSPQESRTVAYTLCAALMAEEDIHPDSLNYFLCFSEKAGIPRGAIQGVFSGKTRFLSESSINRRASLIAEALGTEPARAGAPVRDTGKEFYVANQVSREGLDELQRLILAGRLGAHVAIDGPPGVGKTKCVMEVSRILRKQLFTKTCSNRTTESHIISHPVLTESNGLSVTAHRNGPLCLAMEAGGIFYGDEFNLLKEDVQKRLNSAFDERRCVDRNDGLQVGADPGFWAVISYNPTQNLVGRDLEDSVADRFVHLHFSRWTPDFKAYVSSRSAEGADPLADAGNGSFGIELGWRGIGEGTAFLRGEAKGGRIEWFDFFTGNPVPGKPLYVYRVYDRESLLKNQGRNDLETLAAQSYNPLQLSRMIARFTDAMHSLAHTGKSPLLKKIGLGNIVEDEDLELLSIHEGSTRIETAALRHYHELLGRGCNRYLAQSYAVRLVIDQLCYGQYRNKRLRNTTVHALAMNVAKAMRLFADGNSFNTNFDIAGVLDSAPGSRKA